MISPDRRGRKKGTKPKRITDQMIKMAKTHIESFPKVESHYCRESTSRFYLEAGLNIRAMYRLYVETMKEEKIPKNQLISASLYRKTFRENYNYYFHKPKKDRCNDCFIFDNLSEQDKRDAQKDHDDHLQKMKIARNYLKNDKISAANDTSVCCATFDLQKVLTVPRCEASSFFYKRKVSAYNFTIYDITSTQGDTF